MMGVWITYAVLMGLFIGSFLKLAADRLPKGESVVGPPSHCHACGHRLHFTDLVPIFSYLLLKGRCRYCGAAFSSAYFWSELTTGLLFGLVTWRIGFRPELLAGLLLVCLLLTVTWTDLRCMVIPDRIVGPAIKAGMFIRLFVHTLPIWNYGLALLAGGALLYSVAWAGWRKTGRVVMGGGDIKLLAAIGLYVGLQKTILTLLLASLVGLLAGIGLRKFGKVSKGQGIPFAPFLAVGALIAYLWGDGMIMAYNHWLLERLDFRAVVSFAFI